nr:hypothetical protein [Tanacetum cinerariifolium]
MEILLESTSNKLSVGVESSNIVRRPKSKDTKSKSKVLKNTNAKSSTSHVQKMSRSASIDTNKHETMHSNVIQLVLWIVDSGCSKHMTGNLQLLRNLLRNSWEQKFCDGDLEEAFRLNTCYVRNLEDLDNLFGPLYEENYAMSSLEVSDNSTANTLDDENTSSSSSIIVEEDEAPQIVSSSAEQIVTELNSSVLNENVDELVQEDVSKFDRNVFYNPPQTPLFEEAESSSTFQDPSNMYEFHQQHRSSDRTVNKVLDTKDTIKFMLDTKEFTYTVDMFRVTLHFQVETPENPFVAPVNIQTIKAFMNRVGYQGVIDKVNTFYTKNLAQPWKTMFKEIRTTDEFKEYETMFMNVDVPMNQPQPIVSTQGTYRSTPRAHRIHVLTASPQGKKRKQIVGESSDDRERDEVAEATILSLTLHKTALVAEAQENIAKVQEKLDKEEIENMVKGDKDEESYASEFADSVLNDYVDDSGTRLEPDSHKENPENVNDDDEEIKKETNIMMLKRRMRLLRKKILMLQCEMIKQEMPRLVNLAVNKDRKVDHIKTQEMITKEFATHGPKMIEELF